MSSLKKVLPVLVALCVALLAAWNVSAASGQEPGGQPALEKPLGMFELYQQNRKHGLPNYITEDFLILASQMTLERAVGELEEKAVAPAFAKLVAGLASRLSREKKPGAATKANLRYLAVIAHLLAGKGKAADQAVNQELVLINGAKGLARSPLMGQMIDYGQFKPRGKYAASPRLGRYFQGMKYANTVLFPIKESKATGISAQRADRLTAQAVELVRAIRGDRKLAGLYAGIESDLGFLFGPADDLTDRDYARVLAAKANAKAKTAQLRAALLAHAKKHHRLPRIIGGVVDGSKLEKGVGPAEVMAGFRLMPSRYTPESAALQELVYNKVGIYLGKKKPFSLAMAQGKPVKGFPLPKELMALLGSGPAGELLAKADEVNYRGYAAAAKRARAILAKSHGLAGLELMAMNYWLARGSQEDARRRLNTCLAWWTLSRHGKVLYAKQSYTVSGKGLSMDPERKTAFLEPAPELYGYLLEQARAMAARVKSPRLAKLAGLLERCRDLAARAAMGAGFGKSQVDFLNNLDLSLLECTGGKDAPIVTDLHTEPTSRLVVQAGVGLPKVAAPGRQRGRGGLMSYHLFKQPMDKRLTDQEWLKKLK